MYFWNREFSFNGNNLWFSYGFKRHTQARLLSTNLTSILWPSHYWVSSSTRFNFLGSLDFFLFCGIPHKEDKNIYKSRLKLLIFCQIDILKVNIREIHTITLLSWSFILIRAEESSVRSTSLKQKHWVSQATPLPRIHKFATLCAINQRAEEGWPVSQHIAPVLPSLLLQKTKVTDSVQVWSGREFWGHHDGTFFHPSFNTREGKKSLTVYLYLTISFPQRLILPALVAFLLQ